MRLIARIRYEADGYSLASTDGLRAHDTTVVWYNALPSMGSSTSPPIGVTLRRGFPLSGGQWALSSVTVTDERDEFGRQGLMRADVRGGSRHALLQALACSSPRPPDGNTALRIPPQMIVSAAFALLLRRHVHLASVDVLPADTRAHEAMFTSLVSSLLLLRVPFTGFTSVSFYPTDRLPLRGIRLQTREACANKGMERDK